MKRRDFQDLATVRLKEAKVLLRAGCYEGAYYLAGYAVECAFKALIAKGTLRHDFPDRDRVVASYTHKLMELAKLAGLDKELRSAENTYPELSRNWITVRNWSEASRYDRPSASDAEEIVKAVEERTRGLLPWLKRRW